MKQCQMLFSLLTLLVLGTQLNINSDRFLGPYEHHYADNFSKDNYSTHYIVLAFEIMLDIKLEGLPKQQHTQYCWVPEKEIHDSTEIHENNRMYFQ